ARGACLTLLTVAEQDDSNSFCTLCRDAARRADEVDARVNNGEELPLAGVPAGIKDNICTEGVRTTCASKLLENFVPSYSATAWKKLRAAGAVLIGKTNLDEFAVGSDGTSSAFGKTKNPLDAERTPGGSSSGSGAALAAHLCAVSLGSDTGGSSRVPASFCGVTTLKPTWGAVSRYGLVALANSFDQICPMAGNVRGTALVFDAIRGRDERDMTSYDVDFEMKIPDVRGLRIGVFCADGCFPEVRAAAEKTASFLERSGASADEITLPHHELAAGTYYTLSSTELASNLSRFDGIRYGSSTGGVMETRKELFGKKLKERIAEGAYVLKEKDSVRYSAASAIRREMCLGMDSLFGEYDLIITPAAQSAAVRFGESLYGCDEYTAIANLTGCPALVTPSGVTQDGLPIGVQLMARHGAESLLLGAASLVEEGRTK
ncbi:MAG: aspartyl/glutamyl-tRNA amidotransferase subunit A, partial [Clostridia bacterium]|nr:aspartyl/glutamyl-tRNA amidotransferase subunit A [Clostridia bacterium]